VTTVGSRPSAKRYAGFVSYSHAADGNFAPTLQNGLQRLAKPWRQRRALEIFRDDTGLSVNPNLWTSIATALDNSRYFILLASPDAAQSPWVGKEIQHWIATHGTDTILPVLTDGTWTWDPTHNNFAWDQPHLVTAVHPALHNVFPSEPRHLDMSWAKTETQLTLRNPRFRDQIAQIAAPLHGISKDDLESEDIRQQRRTQRTQRGAITTLTLLTITALIATLIAITSQHEATTQRDRADRRSAEARARTRSSVARRLATTSRTAVDLPADLRLLLAAQAYEMEPGARSSAALFDLLTAAWYDESDTLSLVDPDPTTWNIATTANAIAESPVRSIEDVTGRAGPEVMEGPFVFDGDGALITAHRPGQPETGQVSDTDFVPTEDWLPSDGAIVWAADTWQPHFEPLDVSATVRARSRDGRFTLMDRFDTTGLATVEDREGNVVATLPLTLGASSDHGLGRHRRLFTPSGARLLSLDDGLAEPQITDTTTGATIPVRRAAGDGTIDSFGLIDDDRAWYICGRRLQIVDLADGTVGRTIELPRAIAAAAFTGDGDTIVTSWNTSAVDVRRGDGTLERTIPLRHNVNLVEIDPTGRWAAAAGDGGVSVISLEERALVGSIRTTIRELPVDSILGFSSSGTGLTAIPYDAPSYFPTVVTVSLDTDRWHDHACFLAGRSFTDAEWAQYVDLPGERRACTDASGTPITAPATTVPPTITFPPTSPPTTSPPTTVPDPTLLFPDDLRSAIAETAAALGYEYDGICRGVARTGLCASPIGDGSTGSVLVQYWTTEGMLEVEVELTKADDGSWARGAPVYPEEGDIVEPEFGD